VESVEQAISKVIKHFDWRGPVGISVTYATSRVLGNQAAGKTLESMLPNSRGKVATMERLTSALQHNPVLPFRLLPRSALEVHFLASPNFIIVRMAV